MPTTLLLLLCSAACAQDFDLVLRGGTVVDGSGKPGFVGDVAIKGDRIVAVGKVVGTAKRTVDAAGMVVCPGFIDVHTHCDRGILEKDLRGNVNYLAQGVTTVVTGNCGFGHVDAAEFFRKLSTNGVGTNVAHQVPHGSVREAVMGIAERAPTADELAKMKALVRQAMKDGAVGLASGLFYTPGSYAETSELIELAKVVAEFDGVYASHIRSEGGSGLVRAILEAIEIGEKGGVPVQISHIKCSGVAVWGMAGEPCKLIEAARARGLDVTADQYPYAASSTGMVAAFLGGVGERGKALKARLDDPADRVKLLDIATKSNTNRGGDERTVIARFVERPDWEGKNLKEIAAELKVSAGEAVLKMLEIGSPQIVSFNMRDDDVEHFMKQPWVFTCSDGGTVRLGDARPHPRSYGTYPRKLRVYVYDKKLITLETAIRSMTDLPARKFRLADRGSLRAGAFADVVMFDPKTVADAATYIDPHRYAVGIPLVIVNGKPAIDAGKFTDTFAGLPLKPQGKR